jgi:hypothetical protein
MPANPSPPAQSTGVVPIGQAQPGVTVDIPATTATLISQQGNSITLQLPDGTILIVPSNSAFAAGLQVVTPPLPSPIGPFTLDAGQNYDGTVTGYTPAQLYQLGKTLVSALAPIVGP